MRASRQPSVAVPETHLRFRWPPAGPRGECDNYFLGIWHPDAALRVELIGTPPAPCAQVSGDNWILAGATSPVHPDGAGLVHARADGGGAIAFRGYVLGANVHSYSDSTRLLDFWLRDPLGEHNGVYSAAVIGAGGETLVLCADMFGMSPVYYASVGDAIIFATNPRYLRVAGAEPDRLAWRCLLETGFLASDLSLSRGVRRLPAGQALQASRAGVRLVPHYDLAQLPDGTRTLDDAGIADVERAFQQAMERCLALDAGRLVLPLGSGHDSRRMLAGLVDRGLPFESVTCRVFHGGRDLDARYAAEMARDLGFPHTIVEPSSPARYVERDVARRLLLDCETFSHTWALDINEALPAEPAVIYDGLAGDALGDPGFRLPGLYRSPRGDIDVIVADCVRNAFRRVLDPAQWPGGADVAALLRAWLETLPQRANLAEYAFLLSRVRRSTALQALPLVPPGRLVVFPFLDLDYVRLLFEFSPADKNRTVLQRACLARYWPRYYKYPGTRDVPRDAVKRPADADLETILLCFTALLDEVVCSDGVEVVRGLLSRRGRLGFAGAQLSRTVASRAHWYCTPLMELVVRDLQRPACWEAADPAVPAPSDTARP
jgi:hypothetical protein